MQTFPVPVMFELLYFVICVVVIFLLWLIVCEESSGCDVDSDDADAGPYACWENLDGSSRVEKLTNTNINRVVKSKRSILVLFYAPWCSHCHTMIPDYVRAAVILADQNSDVTLAAINCDAFPQVKTLHHIRGYPTINYYRNGKYIGEYNSDRTTNAFVKFMRNPPTTQEELRCRARDRKSLESSDSENGC